MCDDESIFFLINDNLTLYKEAIDDLFGAHITGGELEILATCLAKLRKEK
tara:strand:- start:3843 stop:3992 length:150 start_codon:yes stop_codon:yes gene_type:complete